ncbi:hypothetical protein DNTS_032808 [Danionella cerebrum]|uniref:SUEL-type lectin domain-containing protein n=1 Tax=Danionella cerebrum TaxID=2873325 RepID=A0A553PXT5_9TELE|nr:hypothetical protein DNTS_032808 [Danionella translucida]
MAADGGVIQITSASFGRTDRRVCSQGRPGRELRNTNCVSPNALAPVSQRCDGQQSCELYATSAIFADPCSTTACEQSNAALSCDQGLVIHVRSANYGRTDGETCSQGRPPAQVSRTNCYFSNSLTLGTNESSCTIAASNSVFSDPCVNTYKFLYVSYACVYQLEVLGLKVKMECSRKKKNCPQRDDAGEMYGFLFGYLKGSDWQKHFYLIFLGADGLVVP